MTTTQRKRLKLTFFFFAACYLVVMANAFVIQVLQGSFFASLAHNQHKETGSTVYRAEILDRNNRLLALTVPAFSVFVIPSKLKQGDKTSTFLAQAFPRAYSQLQTIYPHFSSTHFMYVKRHLEPAEIELIKQTGLKDLHLIREPARFYPVESMGPIIGITDLDNKGLCGIEKACNQLLTTEKNAGAMPVKLTLDANLQFLTYEEVKAAVNKLEAVEAAALIMDPEQGDLLALAHYPDFDPNKACDLQNLENMKNKIVTETYELGSVIKVFLALAALEERVVLVDEIIDCCNSTSAYINGFKVNTLRPHGLLTFSQVIELSNNIGTSKVAQRLGQKLYDHYRRCGFGEKTGLVVGGTENGPTFPGEQKGFVNPPSRWSKLSIFSLSFGYELRATLLQLARAFSLLARDGTMVTPRLILSPSTYTEKLSPPLYSSTTIALMRDILQKTITRGTAKRARINGYTVLGKTGSANLLVNGLYQPNKNIFTFVGLIEKGSYKRIIVTFIKEPNKKNVSSSSTVVPLFEKIAQKMLIQEKII